MAENIALDEKKRVVLLQPPAVAKPHYLFYVWKALSSDKPKTLKKWMKYYLDGFSVKIIRRIVNAVIHSLLVDGCLIREMKRGIFHERVNYRVHQQAIQDIQYSLRTALLEDGALTSYGIALAVLMREGGLLQKYFRRRNKKRSRHGSERQRTAILGPKLWWSPKCWTSWIPLLWRQPI